MCCAGEGGVVDGVVACGGGFTGFGDGLNGGTFGVRGEGGAGGSLLVLELEVHTRAGVLEGMLPIHHHITHTVSIWLVA